MKNLTYMERVERKYELAISEDSLPALRHDVNQYLPAHEFTPGQAVTINNTLYFDNEDFLFLRNGLANKADHARIRARKYEYDSTPSNGPAYYWIELRIRKGEIRKKQRLKLEKGDFQRLLEGREIDEKVLGYNQSYADSERCKRLYREIQDIIIEKTLKPVLLVSYSRVAFERGEVRLTVDWDIRYRQAGPSVFHYKALRDLPEQPCGFEKNMVLELKYSGGLPPWVSGLQQKYPIRPRIFFSKLDGGMKALLEGPLRSRPHSKSLLDMISAYETLERESLVGQS
jgi:hypothetical protein